MYQCGLCCEVRMGQRVGEFGGPENEAETGKKRKRKKKNILLKPVSYGLTKIHLTTMHLTTIHLTTILIYLYYVTC